jgi:ketosteroid isomerase-like protein
VKSKDAEAIANLYTRDAVSNPPWEFGSTEIRVVMNTLFGSARPRSDPNQPGSRRSG